MNRCSPWLRGQPGGDVPDGVERSVCHSHDQVVRVVVGERQAAAVDAVKGDDADQGQSLVAVGQGAWRM
jgi:hypothetical protein